MSDASAKAGPVTILRAYELLASAWSEQDRLDLALSTLPGDLDLFSIESDNDLFPSLSLGMVPQVR